ncbi:hypothetical protein [Streptomyces sp. TE5632]
MPLTEAETVAVERIVTAHLSSFLYEDEESLYLYGDGGSEPDEIAAGSTTMPRALCCRFPAASRRGNCAAGRR